MIDSPTLDMTIIIPFKDKAEMTLDCIRSLFSYGPPVKKILLVSNNSSDNELDLIKAGIKEYASIELVIYNFQFNYQKMNNWAAAQVKTKFIFFFNNDTELRPSSRALILRMVEKASEPKVGITGCLLLYGDDRTIQHGGVYLRPKGQADHMYVGRSAKKALTPDRDLTIFPYDLTTDLPMTAVTGAAQIIETEKFRSVGGFDERFIICGGDVDLCIRLNKAGLQTWFVSGGHIIHKESQSRSFKPVPYNDFFWSYKSYMQGFDIETGDPFLPLITNTKDYRC